MVTIFVSALVGAVAAYGLSQAQWRREDRLRWLQDRRQAYRDFLVKVDNWELLDYEAAVNGEIEEWYEAPPEDRLDPLLGVQSSTRLRPRANVAASAVSESLTDLSLVASRRAVDVATEVHTAMRSLSDVRMTSPPRACGGVSGEHNEAQMHFQEARKRFVSLARGELGADGRQPVRRRSAT